MREDTETTRPGDEQPTLQQPIPWGNGGYGVGYGPAQESEDEEILLKKIPVMLYRFRYLIACFTILGLGLGALRNYTTTPAYDATAIVRIGSYMPGKDSGTGRLLREETNKASYLKSLMPLLASSAIATKVLTSNETIRQYVGGISSGNLSTEAREDESRVSTAEISSYLSHVWSEEVRDTPLLRIFGRSSAPDVAAVLANAHADAFRRLVAEETQRTAESKVKLYERELRQATQKVEELRAQRADYARENGILIYGSGTTEQAFETRLLDSLNNMNKAVFDRITTEAGYRGLRESSLQRGVGDDQQLKTAAMESQAEDFAKVLGQAHVATKITKEQLKFQKNTLRKYKQMQVKKAFDAVQEARDKEQLFSVELDKLHQKQLIHAEHKMKLEAMSKDMARAEETQLESLHNYEDAVFEVENQQDTVVVVDSAVPPAAPSLPKKGLNLSVGLLLGSFVGVLLSLFLDFADNTIRNFSQLEQHTDVPVLGSVPAFSKSIQKKSDVPVAGSGWRNSAGQAALQEENVERESPESILLTAPCSYESESFRTIQTALIHGDADVQPKTILVTSSQPGEGKTTLAVNLAVAFAQLGERTLLIDTDMRLPSVQDYFRLSVENRGLADYLIGKTNYGEYLLTGGVEHLSLLLAGRLKSNPVKLLRSEKFLELLRHVSAEYDYVVIDCPPIGPVADALVLAKEADGVALVVRSGYTPLPDLTLTISRLKRARANILGTVLNDIRRADHYREAGFGYYQYQSYYTYGGDGSSWDRSGSPRIAKDPILRPGQRLLRALFKSVLIQAGIALGVVLLTAVVFFLFFGFPKAPPLPTVTAVSSPAASAQPVLQDAAAIIPPSTPAADLREQRADRPSKVEELEGLESRPAPTAVSSQLESFAKVSPAPAIPIDTTNHATRKPSGGEVIIGVKDGRLLMEAVGSDTGPTVQKRPLQSTSSSTPVPPIEARKADSRVAKMEGKGLPESEVPGQSPHNSPATAFVQDDTPTPAGTPVSRAVDTADSIDTRIDKDLLLKPDMQWYLQLCAQGNVREAISFTRELRAAGHSAFIEELKQRPRSLYRVVVGPYKSQKAALQDAQKFKVYPYTAKDPFARIAK